MWERETDTSVLNLEISPILRVARITSCLYQLYDLHEIRLTQMEALLERKYFIGSMHTHRAYSLYLKTSGGLEAYTSTSMFKKYGERKKKIYIQ